MAANILHPRRSLRRLRTAFTLPSASAPSSRPASEFSTSPLSAHTSSSSGSFAGFNFDFGNHSSTSLILHPRRIIRRKRSTMEEQREEERLVMGDELVGLVEPRPSIGLANIEEILEGSN